LILDLEKLPGLNGGQGFLDPAVVFLYQVQSRPLAFEPAPGHVLRPGVVERAVLVGLDKLVDELGAANRLLPQLVLVLAIDGPELLRVRGGEFHDPVDDLHLGGVEVRPQELEVIVNIVVHFGDWGRARVQCHEGYQGHQGGQFNRFHGEWRVSRDRVRGSGSWEGKVHSEWS
jgi:hypothetical protein